MQKTAGVFYKALSFLLCLAVVFGVTVPLFANMAFSADSSVDDAVHLEKTYDPNTGNLMLEAYVTGETVTTTHTEVVPEDIVLVLDATSSMEWDCNVATSAAQLAGLCKDYAGDYQYKTKLIGGNKDVRFNESTGVWEYNDGGWQPITRFDSNHRVHCERIVALKAATLEFVRKVAKESAKTRIAIITFGSRKSEIEIKSPFTFCDATGEASLEAAVKSIDADNASTAQSTGIVAAMDLIKSTVESDKISGISTSRGKTMILFTDGEPVAEDYDDGIEAAYNVKNNADVPGIRLFTIGMFSSAEDEIDDYMDYMSSKYPLAKSMSNHGKDDGTDNVYYYSVKDSYNINNIFDKISEDVFVSRPKIETLNSETIVRDIITEQFVLNSTVDHVTVYTAPYLGVNPDGSAKWGDKLDITSKLKQEDINNIKYDASTQTLDVTGFDFSANWCGIDENSSVHGSKLIVIIPILPKESGLISINTNAPGSGIIPPDEDGPLSDFPIPYTDLPASVPIKAVFDGSTYPISDSFKFDVDVETNGYINGFTEITGTDEKGNKFIYNKAETENHTFDTVTFDKAYTKDTSVENLLVDSTERDSTLTVKLADVSPDYDVTVADNKGTSQTFKGGGNISKTFDVKEGQEITVTFKKIAANRTDVTVTTAVGGNCSDKNQAFELSGSYVKAGVSQDLSESVKHGDTLTYKNIDVGSEFKISQEAVEGYITTVKVNGEELMPESGVYKFTVDDNDSVEIYNYADVEVPVGLSLDFGIPISVLSAALIIAFSLIKGQMSKRRYGEEI